MEYTVDAMNATTTHPTITMPLRFLPLLLLLVRLFPTQPDWTVPRYLLILLLATLYAFFPLSIPNTDDPTTTTNTTTTHLHATITSLNTSLHELRFRLANEKNLTKRESTLYARAISDLNALQDVVADLRDENTSLRTNQARLNRLCDKYEDKYDRKREQLAEVRERDERHQFVEAGLRADALEAARLFRVEAENARVERSEKEKLGRKMHWMRLNKELAVTETTRLTRERIQVLKAEKVVDEEMVRGLRAGLLEMQGRVETEKARKAKAFL